MAMYSKHKPAKEKTAMGHAGDAAKSTVKAVGGAAKAVGSALHTGLKAGEKAWSDLDLRDKKNDDLRASITGRSGRIL